MAKTSTKTIIDRALGLADIGTDAEYIDYNDKTNSLNEAYKDIYAKLTHSDDDYYVKQVVLYPSNAQLNPTGNPSEYLLDLPEDVYKIRFVDYKGSSNWVPMRKFNTGMRDFVPSETMYRWSGDKLWIIGSAMTGLSEIRVTYYPPPKMLTLQRPSLVYNVNSTIANRSLVTSSQPLYVQENNTLIYNVFNVGVSNTLVADDLDNNIITTIYTATDLTTPLTSIQYAEGYLYWIGYNSVSTKTETYKAAWDGALAGTPISYNMLGLNQLKLSVVYSTLNGSFSLYITTATDVYTSSTAFDVVPFLLSVAPFYNYFNITLPELGETLSWVSDTNVLVIGTTTITDIISAVSDGISVYALNTKNQLVKYSFIYNNLTALIEVVNEGVLYYNAKKLSFQNTMGYYDQQVSDMYIGLIDGVTNELLAVDSNSNSNLDYPLNAVYEIMSYQCAIDFKRKQSADTNELLKRWVVLVKRFEDSIKRDEYEPERIKNFYVRNSNGSFGW